MSYVIIPAGITDTQLPYGVTLQFSEKGVFTTAFNREEQALANFKNLLFIAEILYNNIKERVVIFKIF